MCSSSSSSLKSTSRRTCCCFIIASVLAAIVQVTTSFVIPPASKEFTKSIGQQQHTFRLHQSVVVEEEEENIKQPHVVILGGGFGGVNTALTLASLPFSSKNKPRITLIDRKDRFVFLPLLYELCVDDASLDEVAPTYKELLKGSDVEFQCAELEGIDVENDIVHTSSFLGKKGESGIVSQEQISYDALVVATGAEIDLKSIPGAEQFALPFYTVEECFELKRRLALFDQANNKQTNKHEGSKPINVVVVGGGYSGVELALNLSERLGKSSTSVSGEVEQEKKKKNVKVTIVHRGDEVLEYATDYNKNIGTDRLKKAGVEIMTQCSVTEIQPAAILLEEDDHNESKSPLDMYKCTVHLQNRNSHGNDSTNTTTKSIDADLLLWTAGATPPNPRKGIRNSLLPRDQNGRIVTGPLLRAKGCTNVFAVGDCSRAKQVPYAATAQVAMQQAPVAAWNIYATLTNNAKEEEYGILSDDEDKIKLLPFSYANLGEMMTLGSDDATISSLGGLFQLSGESASVLRRLIYAVRMPTARQGLVAALDGTERRVNRKTNKRKTRKKVIGWK